MLEKLKQYIAQTITAAKDKINGMQMPIKWIIVGYLSLVLVFVLTYYIAWLYLWHSDKASLTDLFVIINEMVGPAMIGFVTFIGGCFVDLNNNGVPDQYEKEGEKNEGL